jgi:NADH-quinone oxidoreductase subunit D
LSASAGGLPGHASAVARLVGEEGRVGHSAAGEISADVVPAALRGVLERLGAEPSLGLTELVDLAAVAMPGADPGTRVVYHLRSPRTGQPVRVRSAPDADGRMASVATLYPVAGMLEDEAADAFGIRFEPAPAVRPSPAAPGPLRQVAEVRGHARGAADGAGRAGRRTRRWQSAAEASLGRPGLTLELQGETVVDAALAPQDTHRPIERACEALPWSGAVARAEALAPGSGPLVATALCRGIERLMSVEVPERARWLRVLAGEIARVAAHLDRLAAACAGWGASVEGAWLASARDEARAWLEALTGAADGGHFVRIGGVRCDAEPAVVRELAERIPRVDRAARDVAATLRRARRFGARVRDVAVLDRDACTAGGVTGVMLRAAGVPWDLRRRSDGSVYDALDFDLPVGGVGDAHDRLWVRVTEVRESLRLVEQCLARLEALGAGPTRADDPRLAWPAAVRPFDDAAQMIHHTLGVLEGTPVAAGEVYESVETPDGELGFYLVSDGGPVPVRVRCRSPRFFNTRAAAGALRGVPLDEVGPTLALMNVVPAAWDRS